MAAIQKLSNILPFILKVSNCPENHRLSVNFYNIYRYNKHLLRRRAIQLVNNSEAVPSVLTQPSEISEINRFINGRENLLGNNYIELQKNERLFKKISISMRKRAYRERQQKIVLEGIELVETALKAGIKVQNLFYSKDDILKNLENHENFKNIEALKISERSMRDLSENLFSPKVIGICKKPSAEEIFPASNCKTIPVTILCSDIRDPGNMASILTVAAASGCKRMLLLKGCVDVWDRKVINSASGVHFHLPIINNINWVDIEQYLPQDAALYVADSSSDIDIADTQIFIESNEFLTYPAISKNKSDEENSEKTSILHKKTETALKRIENLPCMLYSEISFPKKEIVIYIGGETVGINKRIQKLFKNLYVQKIKLPLENDMDSLNVSVALSVILYEIKRQFTI